MGGENGRRAIICRGGGVPTKQIGRVAVLVIGWALVAVGVVGLFVPVLQGVLFIMLGLYLLSRESRVARGWLQKLRRRYPKTHAKVQQIKDTVKAWRQGTSRDEP